MTTISIQGCRCDYALTDPRPANAVLVFVHGWLLSRQYWQPLMQMLSPHYQCLAYDLRGFGRSTAGQSWTGQSMADDLAGDEAYGLAAYAQDLVALLQALAIDRPVWLVGHSLGGSVALWAAQLAPQQVQGVLCVNAGGGIYLPDEFDKFRSVGQQLVKFRPGWLRYLPGVDRPFAQMSLVQPVDPRWGRQRLVDFLDADADAARSSLLSSTTQAAVHQLPPLVAQLAQPVYFVTGDQDQVMEPRYVKHLASFHRSFPAWGENVLELEACGHMAMLEQPDTVAQYLRSVVQGQLVPACV
jgi:2-succinyl-6-hydroxy-2,4-cyclohexadiene-1-carboxylate synthase